MVIACVVIFPFPAHTNQRDRVNHIACVAQKERAMADVLRIVATQITDVQQVNNNDSLWDSNGSCDRGSVKRQYTTDPQEANERGVWGYNTAGEVILMLVLSENSDSRTDAWWIRLEHIAYFPNQIVNGVNTGDQMAWRVTGIFDARKLTPPKGCVNRTFESEGREAIVIPISQIQRLNVFCDRFGWY